MKILVCGDRKWNDDVIIYRVLMLIHGVDNKATIITGGAEGADSIAHSLAKSMGFGTTEVRADWKRYGRSAGPIRNRAMLDLSPDAVVAFHGFLPNSKGTRDCVEEAQRRGIPVFVFGKKDRGGVIGEFLSFLEDRIPR